MQDTTYMGADLESAEERRQLAREEALFLYSNALHRKDFNLAGVILRDAAMDPVLEAMILDLSPYLEKEFLRGGEAVKESAPARSDDAAATNAHRPGNAKPEEEIIDDWPREREAQELDAEWRYFLRTVAETSESLYDLYVQALDHLDSGDYDAAEQCADNSLQLALDLDDLESAAECLYLYGIIQGAQHRGETSRMLFRVGLDILDQAEGIGVSISDDLRSKLAFALSNPPDIRGRSDFF